MNPLAKHFALYGNPLGKQFGRANQRAKELEAVRTGRYSMVVTACMDPAHVRELRKHVEYVAAETFLHWAFDSMDYPESVWNLNQAIGKRVERNNWWVTRSVTGVMPATWGRRVINWSRPEVGGAILDLVRAFTTRWKAEDTINVLDIEVCARELWRGWFGAAWPLRVDMAAWTSKVDAFSTLFVSPIPVIAGGDRCNVPLSRLHGVKMEDWLHRFVSPQPPTPEDWREEWDGVYSRKRGVQQAQRYCRDGGALSLIDLQWHHYAPGEWERMQRLAIATAICACMRCTITPNPEEPDSPPGPYYHPWMDLDLGTRGQMAWWPSSPTLQAAYSQADVVINLSAHTQAQLGDVVIPPMDAGIIMRSSRGRTDQ